MTLTTVERQDCIARLRAVPAQIRGLVTGLSHHDLTHPHLPGEWTVAQNVHHLADAQMNGFVRCKLTLTEAHPTLKPFDHDAWALTADSTPAEVESSLTILEGVHARWALLLEALTDADWQRTAYHPGLDATLTMDDLVEHFARHGEQHVTQIEETLAAR